MDFDQLAALHRFAAEEGLTLAPARFRAADQMEQVHYRDEADRSAASIIHPSAISSVSQIPGEPVGSPGDEAVGLPPPPLMEDRRIP